MQYTRLGTTGMTVSRICFGCMSYGDGKWREWTLGENEAREHFALALEAGVNFFDTADVYSIGASSMAAWQFSKALYTAKEYSWHKFVAMQNHYNLIYREEEREMNPLCIDQGVALIPWSPLARGLLEGERARNPESGDTKRAQTDKVAKNLYFHENDYEVAKAAQKVAQEHGVTPTQIACAWILQAPGVTAPIIGATKTYHLKEIFEAVDITLTPEQVAAMEEPYQPHPMRGYVQPSPAKMVK